MRIEAAHSALLGTLDYHRLTIGGSRPPQLAASTCRDVSYVSRGYRRFGQPKKKVPRKDDPGPDNPIAWSHLAILLRHLF